MRVGLSGSPAAWWPPLAAALLALGVWAGDANLPLFLALNAPGHGDGALRWSMVTVLGDTAVAVGLLAPLLPGRPALARALLVGGIAATLCVHGIKPLVAQARPAAALPAGSVHVIGPTLRAQAFPSGHTTTAFLLAGLLALRRRSGAAVAAGLGAASLVGVSRAVVGAHWPLDILAGAAVGWGCAALGTAVARRHAPRAGGPGHVLVTAVAAACAAAVLGGLDTGYPAARLWQQGLAALALLALAVDLLRRLERRIAHAPVPSPTRNPSASEPPR